MNIQMVVFGRRRQNPHHFPGEARPCVHSQKLTAACHCSCTVTTDAQYQELETEHTGHFSAACVPKNSILLDYFVLINMFVINYSSTKLLDLLWTHNIKHTNEKLCRRQLKFTWDSHIYIFQLQEDKIPNISQDLTLELKNELHK